MLDGGDTVRKQWQAAFTKAVELLAEEGEYAGPESDPEIWASWVAFQYSEPREWLENRARRMALER